MSIFTRQREKALLLIFIRKKYDPTFDVRSTCGALKLSQEDRNSAFINLQKK